MVRLYDDYGLNENIYDITDNAMMNPKLIFLGSLESAFIFF